MGPLSAFYAAISHDPRIGTTHIALFTTLFHKWIEGGCVNPITIYSHQVMLVAKIGSSATYHRVIRELDEYGYVRYEPSYNRYKGSSVHFID